MAFIVEDGSGVSNANAYIEVVFADDYFTTRNVSAWTGSDDVKKGAIVNATDYIDARFGLRFKGYRKYPEDPPQALEFPRDTEDAFPLNLKKACAEYALRSLTGKLAPDPVADSTGGVVTGKRTKVGPIETELTYNSSQGSAPAIFKEYPAADMLLRGLLKPSGGVIR